MKDQCVLVQRASNQTLCVAPRAAFSQLIENNIKPLYVSGRSSPDETTLLATHCHFCSKVVTFYYFPLDIDFLFSLLNLQAQWAGLCLLLPVNTIIHIHTHLNSQPHKHTLCMCTYYVHTQTRLEDYIKLTRADKEQETVPHSWEMRANVSLCLMLS